jgi:GntR family transcriptional regulator / MocR family aminotransferase
VPVSLLALGIDPGSPVPRYRQLYEGIREAILTGRLGPGARLPSTRVLATETGSGRNTVIAAYEQLVAEGYLEGRVGAGTRVALTLPESLLQARPVTRVRGGTPGPRRALAERGRRLLDAWTRRRPPGGPARPFRTGYPAFDAFPTEVWARLVSRRWARVSRQLLAYGDPAGYRPLREAIATYLREARAVRCDADQVVVLTGSQQGIEVIARVLLEPGEPVWVEDPGYAGAHDGLSGAGLRLVPVPVDAEGMDIGAIDRRAPVGRLVYVTPSHQYPLGVTMSLRRRLALVDWADRTGAWILEDDYDSEYRYAGPPLAALQGLDQAGRVLYLGTFSKVFSPGLRLAYCVAPPDLVEAVVAARFQSDRHPPSVNQAVLADFIGEGHFARHIRRTRALYAERQATLLEAVRRTLGGRLEVSPAAAGLHVLGWLPQGGDDGAASRAAAGHGVEAAPLSAFRIRPGGRGGLVLGYAGFTEREIRDGVHRLARALEGRPAVAPTA